MFVVSKLIGVRPTSLSIRSIDRQLAGLVQINLPIRDIAARWSVDAAWPHHQYATARIEFRNALPQVVAFHNPQALPSEIISITKELLAALL